jgi:hypothetical protein
VGLVPLPFPQFPFPSSAPQQVHKFAGFYQNLVEFDGFGSGRICQTGRFPSKFSQILLKIGANFGFDRDRISYIRRTLNPRAAATTARPDLTHKSYHLDMFI